MLVVAPLVAALVIAQEPAPPRDARPPETGTAVIRGRVVDRETGLPLARVPVSVQQSGRPRETQTDNQGRYEFGGLPAGRYSVSVWPSVFKAFYLRQILGDDGPSDVVRRRHQPLVLKDGEVREGADIALWRALAIEGRVLDEWGDPVSNIQVRAERLGMGGGATDRARTTDDRGMFRLFGLGPGDYRVCAIADSGVVTTPNAQPVRERPVQTCYPAAVREADSQPVSLAANDATGIEIRLQRSRAFSVSGIVLDSTGGAAERVVINIVRIERSSTSGSGGLSSAGGQFTFRGLAPGEYAVSVQIGGGYNSQDTREVEVGYLPFRVEASDVEGLVVTMARPAKVAGRVVFEEGWPPARRRPPLTVQVRFDRSTHRPMGGPPPSASVKDDLTFELVGLYGPQLIGISGYPMDEWTLKAIRYRGEEILNIPTEFRTSTDPKAFEIVLTNRGARLSGRVLDARGVAAEDGSALVLIFPASPQEWRPDGNVVGSTASPRDSAFRLGPLRPGEYLVVAVPIEDYIMPRDTAAFERLAKVAEKVTLLEGDQRTIDLTVVKVP